MLSGETAYFYIIHLKIYKQTGAEVGQEVCLVCLFVEKLIHQKEQMHYVNYLYTLFTPEIEPLNYILLLVIIGIIVV